ncbi:MAG: SDR family NAD(P)-dependent oxidoreductase, partial [Spirochaetota bacterium]
MRMKSKIALITGAAQGLGATIAQRLAEEGATVFVCDLNESAGAAVVEEIRGKRGTAYFKRLDVTDEASWIEAVQTGCCPHTAIRDD